MIGSNPNSIYIWLCATVPKTEKARINWMHCASSLLVYCILPTYLPLGFNEELKIRKLAKDYNIPLSNHLDEFNKNIIT